VGIPRFLGRIHLIPLRRAPPGVNHAGIAYDTTASANVVPDPLHIIAAGRLLVKTRQAQDAVVEPADLRFGTRRSFLLSQLRKNTKNTKNGPSGVMSCVGTTVSGSGLPLRVR
jgi:hypothetical protein